ncbi:hypothetical protein FOXYSP1_19470 [Fusarium oxysporum f. sp. phaseoli]
MALFGERRNLNLNPTSSESESGVTARGDQQTPRNYQAFTEASMWQDFDSRKRSAEYHLNKSLEFLHGFQGTNEGPAGMERQGIKVSTEVVHGLDRESINKSSQSQWRLKVEHDKATRDLIAMEDILSMFKSILANTTEVGSHITKAGIYLTILSSSCFVAHNNFSWTSDIVAMAGALYAGYGVTKSTCRGAYVYLRMTVLENCHQIVQSLRTRVQKHDLNEDDGTWFQNYWFTLLDQFKPEDSMEGEIASPNIRQAAQNSGLAVESRVVFPSYTIE